MDEKMFDRTYERCKEIGIFRMKCLKQFENETWADRIKNFVDLMYENDTDDMHGLARRVITMSDEEFELLKPVLKFQIRAFDRRHRQRSIDPFEHLKLF